MKLKSLPRKKENHDEELLRTTELLIVVTNRFWLNGQHLSNHQSKGLLLLGVLVGKKLVFTVPGRLPYLITYFYANQVQPKGRVTANKNIKITSKTTNSG